jgi:hypothetical protein
VRAGAAAAPAAGAQPQVATALYDYTAQNEDETSIRTDDKVLILDGM